MINLNIVTWGTRETAPSQQPTQPQAPATQVQKKDSNIFDDIGSYFNGKNKWDFRCMCCTSTKNEEELYYLRDIKDSIGKVNTEINSIKSNVTVQTKIAKADLNLKRRSSMMFASRKVAFDDNTESRPLMDFIDDDEEIDEALNNLNSTLEENNHEEEKPAPAQFSAQNPPWIRDEGLENAKVVSIKENERNFWIAFVAKYLAPLIEDKAHQDKVAADLIDLRNKAVFGFGIINIIFVLFVYLLQMNKDIFSITFHVNKHQNGTTIDPDSGDALIVYTDTQINMDPISLILIIFFGSILFIQFIGMFLHRFGTITHLLAFTDISFFEVREEDILDDKIVDQNSVPIVKFIMKKYDKNTDDDPNFSMEKHFQKYYLGMRPQNLGSFNYLIIIIRFNVLHLLYFFTAKEMKLSRRKSVHFAHELANRQKTARRMSLSAEMHARHLRTFAQQQQQQQQNFHDGSDTESEPEIMTQFGKFEKTMT